MKILRQSTCLNCSLNSQRGQTANRVRVAPDLHLSQLDPLPLLIQLCGTKKINSSNNYRKSSTVRNLDSIVETYWKELFEIFQRNLPAQYSTFRFRYKIIYKYSIRYTIRFKISFLNASDKVWRENHLISCYSLYTKGN